MEMHRLVIQEEDDGGVTRILVTTASLKSVRVYVMYLVKRTVNMKAQENRVGHTPNRHMPG